MDSGTDSAMTLIWHDRGLKTGRGLKMDSVLLI